MVQYPPLTDRVSAQSETTGDIATCSGNTLCLWDVNGRALGSCKTGSAAQAISAVAWSLVRPAPRTRLTRPAQKLTYVRAVLQSEVVPIAATGHVGGRISIWRRVADPQSETGRPRTASGATLRRATLTLRLGCVTGWQVELVVSLQIEDRLGALGVDSPQGPARGGAPDKTETVSALTFTSRSLYVGTVSGKVFLYNLAPTEMHLSDSSPLAAACMACRSRFGLLEGATRAPPCRDTCAVLPLADVHVALGADVLRSAGRKRCAGCAGVFCGLCTTRSVEAGGRFCGHCFSRLSPLFVQ